MFTGTENEVDFTKGITQLHEFSSTLANVLASLGAGFNDLRDKFYASQREMQKVKEIVYNAEDDLKKIKTANTETKTVLDEALESHTHMERHVVNQVSEMTGDLHNDLLSLRSTIKSELTTMQGSFSQLLTESLGNLSHGSSVKIPEITADSTPQDILQVVVGRLSGLEQRMNAQQAINSTLSQAVKADYQVQDHFDALTAQMSLLERQVNSQKKLIASLEGVIENLSSSQQRAVSDLEEKVTTLLSAATQNPAPRGRSRGSLQGGLQVTTPLEFEPVFGNATSRQAYLYGVEDPFMVKNSNRQSITSEIGRPLIPDVMEPDNNQQRRVSTPGSSFDPSQLNDLSAAMIKRIEDVENKLADYDVCLKVEILDKSTAKHKEDIDELKESMRICRGDITNLRDLEMEIRRAETKSKNSDIEAIEDTKVMWRRVLADINIGLDNLHVNASEGGGGKTDQLVPSLGIFRMQLQSCLPSFELLDSAENTLDILYPKLDALTAEATRLMDLDKEARLPKSLGVTFDDLICTDRTYNLAEHIENACDFSSKILDKRVQKIQLKRRLERVERQMSSKANYAALSDLERDLRMLIAAKADMRDVEGILGKKASVAELQQFRELMFNHIEDIRSSGFTGGSHLPGSLNRHSGTEVEDGLKLEKDELVRRFELLYRQFQDLMAHCASFVPRDEVEAALHTVLSEVKVIKTNYVDVTSMRDKLKKKADSSDLDRLLTLLSANLTENERTASALHAKCLVCDKPVANIAPVLVGSSSTSALPPSGSPTQSLVVPGGRVGGYDKRMEKESDRGRGGDGSREGGRASSAASGTKPTKKSSLSISAEVSVMRSSIDLPPIGETSANGAGQFHKPFKQRIRSSAGGGAGPSYTLDSR